MAVQIKFISLVIPRANIERVFQGGFTGFLAANRGMLGSMVWSDEHLCRADGAMNWHDIPGMVEFWEGFGLQGLAQSGADSSWQEFAVVISRRGPSYPCGWLIYDESDNCAYLRGTEKGIIVREQPEAE
jgi:hypothetical protein